MTNANPQMPTDPGAPENNDEEYVSPDQAETLADEAAETEALDADEDPLTATLDEDLADVPAADVEPDADGDGAVSDVELQLAERTESLQRVSAEYANYRRRTERERTQITEQSKASVLTQMLPLLDELDLAEQHGDLNEGPLKAFAGKFRSLLEGQRVTPFGSEGEDFDPEVHEAVQDLSSGDHKVIGTVLRKGYRVGDRLVRNAMVIISDTPATGEGASTAGEPTH